MESRSLQVLEFGKVLTHLAGLCVSEAGAEAALAVRPLTGIDAVHHAAALFDEARRWAGHTGFRLSSFPPLDGVFRALDAPATVLDLDALWALRQTLGLARKLAVSIREGQSTGGRWDLLTALVDGHPLPQRTVSGLDRCVSDDGLLRDESSPELSLVRGEIRRIHQQCTRKVKEYAQRYNIAHYLQDEFMTLSSDRYVLPLKSNFKGRLQGIIHDYSQTGETCYFEPMFLVELNNGLQELKREEREEERKVLRYLTDLVRDELASVRGAYDLLVESDVLCARCALSARFEESGDAGAVSVTEGGHVSLLGARHPLLALAAARGEKGGAAAAQAVQPASRAPHATGKGKPVAGHGVQHGPQAVDIELLPGQLGLVISGGNAGGKTVCLKTLGLIALMGLAGLPVPVRPGSSLPFWSDIFAFIGDEQSLEDNVSTFTAQIRHLSGVWDRLGPGALVILDEFGAGTDPAQGAALAQAVLDEVMDAGSTVVAATHFPALKAYALTRDKVRAASVLFDPVTKRPLFRLAYDQVGASQALDVAREHGLPEAVLRRAEQYLLLDGEDTSALVDRLNTLAVQREAEISSLRAEEARLRDKRSKLDERFERERRTLFETVQGQAKTVLHEWKSGKVSHKQALKALAETRARLVAGGAGNGDADGTPASADAPQPALQVESLRTGQAVRYVPWGKKGSVVEVDARRGRVRVDLSGVTMWAEAKDLAALDEKPRVVVGAVTRTISDATASMRVDLRGMRADVAVSELSRALDKALLAGMSAVEAIHGRGTGALRKEIHAFLKSFPAVRSFVLAPEDQGGDGVTIIELK
ncbi:endonuclease MutS2 [Nitratidesulfovibrio liaohensis]|uniref:endonuclease MutS2 n=1 Tax=Nitratidesulfovibrio liaohensis TaxID=2604158 RepID=UPI0014213E3A|nr:Smr/MutS family protein [Nitratidesulfovibrio liaohensis]NHZ46788.1 endonuclease MutS2 [Nitratidesulfovibrio liaohensis]